MKMSTFANHLKHSGKSSQPIVYTTEVRDFVSNVFINNCGTWWLSTLRPEGRRFESHSSHNIRTLGKSFTCSCL